MSHVVFEAWRGQIFCSVQYGSFQNDVSLSLHVLELIPSADPHANTQTHTHTLALWVINCNRNSWVTNKLNVSTDFQQMQNLCHSYAMRNLCVLNHFSILNDFDCCFGLFWSLVFGLFGFVAPSELLHLGLCSPRALQQAGRGAVRNFPERQSVNTGKAKKYTDKITVHHR